MSGTLSLPGHDQVVAPAPPTTIGPYAIGGRLGEGGMGVVYAARHADSGRAVAIKLLRPGQDDAAYAARLVREGQALARIDHPNVVRLHEIGLDGTRLYIVMELVEGMTLDEWSVTPREVPVVIAMFARIGAGLAAVHRAGLVHRDFKPANVLIDRVGRPRVADFGLARVDHGAVRDTVTSDLAATLTRTGMVVGTPGYMAPEQIVGDAVDGRADQYSFCVALGTALAGKAIPPAVAEALARGRAFEPGDRFASMDALVRALAPPRRIWIGVALAIAVVLVAVVAALVWPRASARPPVVAVAAPPPPIDAAAIDAPPIDAPILLDAPVPRPRPIATAPMHLGAIRAAAELVGRVKPITPALLGELTADVQAQRATATDPLTIGILAFTIADLEHRGGACTLAVADWRAARQAFGRTTAPAGAAYTARAELGEALCALEAGDVRTAAVLLDRAMTSAPALPNDARAELSFVAGLVAWETGSTATGKALIIAADRHADDYLKRAIAAYVAAVGLALP